jgi:hypothetical protein
MAAGFWSGFAQGWKDEGDRIERRKLFLDEQKESRIATLTELAARRGTTPANSARGSNGQDIGAPGGIDHNTEVLLNYGYSTEKIAELTAKGPHALQAVVDTTAETIKNKGSITPTLLDTIADSVVVTVNAGEPVDPKALAAQYYGDEFANSLGEDDLAFLGATASRPPSTSVTSTYIPDEPYSVEKANQIVGAANQTLRGAISQERAQIEDQISQLPEDDAMLGTLSKRAAELDSAIAELDEDNPVGAIQMYGQEQAYKIIEPYLAQDPELANAPPGLLGVWGSVINPPQTEAAPAPEVGTIDEGYRFLGGDPNDPNNWEPISG